MASRLKKETLDFVRKNAVAMHGLLSVALGTKIGSVEIYIERNSRRLIELPVLKVISDFTGKQPDELIEEYDDSTESDNVENIKQTA